MARIIKPEASSAPAWKQAGEEVCIIALDSNEVEAVWRACNEYHRRAVTSEYHPTSLNAAGARVYEALRHTP